MPILERNFAAHFAIRKEGVVRPLCKAWRSTWSYTLERDHVTCPQCRVALERQAQGILDAQEGSCAPSTS